MKLPLADAASVEDCKTPGLLAEENRQYYLFLCLVREANFLAFLLRNRDVGASDDYRIIFLEGILVMQRLPKLVQRVVLVGVLLFLTLMASFASGIIIKNGSPVALAHD